MEKNNNKETEQKNKTIKKFEEIIENNQELTEKIDKLKTNIEEKSKNIKKELTDDIKELSEDIKKKSKEIKEDLTEKKEDIKKDLEIKSKEIKKDISKKSREFQKEFKEKTEDIKEKAEEILNNVKDNTKRFDKKDIEENKAMACLAYIIAPVPYFTEYKSKWVKYHSIQGMNLFIIEVLLCLIVVIINSLIFWPFGIIKVILKISLYAFMVIYAVIGIINVCNEEAKELPIINKFKFIKK